MLKQILKNGRADEMNLFEKWMIDLFVIGEHRLNKNSLEQRFKNLKLI